MINNFFSQVIKSFDNGDGGFSSKKLTAFAIVLCVIAAHIKWIAVKDFSLLPTILTIDFSFISVLYGINVTDKKINDKKVIKQ